VEVKMQHTKDQSLLTGHKRLLLLLFQILLYLKRCTCNFVS